MAEAIYTLMLPFFKKPYIYSDQGMWSEYEYQSLHGNMATTMSGLATAYLVRAHQEWVVADLSLPRPLSQHPWALPLVRAVAGPVVVLRMRSDNPVKEQAREGVIEGGREGMHY